MLRWVELGFEAELRSADHGLAFLGPTIRGLLGYSLKQTSCVMPHGDCGRCLLRQRCAYPVVFEGVPPVDRPLRQAFSRIPQPFVLGVAPPGEWFGGPKDLRWTIRLFGRAVDLAPYVVQAFINAQSRGVGAGRTPYELTAITDMVAGRVCWSPGSSTLTPLAEERYSGNAATGLRDGVLRFHAVTPLDLRVQPADPPERAVAEQLADAGRRRLRHLTHIHGDPAADEPRAASGFRVVGASLRRWRIQRFSGRQRARVPLCGWLGEVDIEGPWSEVGAWPVLVDRLHVGRHPTFGLGRLEMECL